MSTEDRTTASVVALATPSAPWPTLKPLEMQTFVDMSDIMTGFWKSLSFGVIVTWVCTYKGFNVGHGAEGVAKATTDAVVLSSVLILVWDYFMGSVLP